MKTKLFLLLTPILLSCFALLPIAQAAPSPSNVNVVNTPNVNVVNTPASPVPVRDVDNPAKQPFQAEAMGGFADGASTTGDIPITTVPAGKRLVIEHVSVFGTMLPGQKMVRAVMHRFSVFGHSLVISAQGSNADGSSDYFVASELIRFYDNDGLPVAWEAERDSSAGANLAGIDINCDGYFVDCPTCAQ
ncbi:MAG: hypothetical protein DMF33_13090 [Verrucomicrobia bacterium]|nr:MAG: hypothetical protein DMF33_13090 [Verrucomicrobiota bacterium]